MECPNCSEEVFCPSCDDYCPDCADKQEEIINLEVELEDKKWEQDRALADFMERIRDLLGQPTLHSEQLIIFALEDLIQQTKRLTKNDVCCGAQGQEGKSDRSGSR